MIDSFTLGRTRLWLTAIDADSPAPRRQREVAARDSLVAAAFGPDAVLSHIEHGAPVISGIPDSLHISISHSMHHAVLAVAAVPVGVDVEEPREQLVRVAHRVMSLTELEHYGSNDPQSLLRVWTAKEALYKAAGVPGADFISEISALPPTVCGCPFELHYKTLMGGALLCVAESA